MHTQEPRGQPPSNESLFSLVCERRWLKAMPCYELCFRQVAPYL